MSEPADPFAESFAGFADAVEIGRGGFGVVYRARDVRLGRTVAIKVLASALDAGAAERFRREGVALALLSEHPNVVPVYDVGLTASGRPYLVMPYLPRGSLGAEVLAGALPWQEVTRIGVRLCGALAAAHSRGILHRDVKPDNVLRSDFDEPLLADFGIARVVGAYETTVQRLTGSVAYAPPEVLDGAPPAASADLYALGATLFTLLAGSAPFVPGDGEALLALFGRITRDPVPDLRPRGVPDSLCTVIETAMAKDPVDRPADAAAFGALLQDVERRAGRPVTTLAVGPAPREPDRIGAHLAIGGDTGTATVDSVPAATSARRRAPARRVPRVGLLGVAVAVAAIVVGLVIWRGRSTGTAGGSSSTVSTGAGDGSVVDADPSAAPWELTDTARSANVHVPSGGAVSIRIAGRAGERILGSVHLATAPASPLPVSLLRGDSPIEQTTTSGSDAELAAVVLDSTATYTVQMGPASAAIDAAVTLSLAPSDVEQSAARGAPAVIALTRPRQRGIVHVALQAGERVTGNWTWNGSTPLYTTLAVLGPAGAPLTTWSALADGRSPVITVPATGTYDVVVTIDGDGTGAGTVVVSPA